MTTKAKKNYIIILNLKSNDTYFLGEKVLEFLKLYIKTLMKD